MRGIGRGVVSGVRGVGCAKVGAGGPALGGEDFVAETRGVVGPGGVVGVVADFSASGGGRG